MVQTDKNAELAAAVLSVVLASVLLGIAIGLVLYARTRRRPRSKTDATDELLNNFEIDSDEEEENVGEPDDVRDLADLELAAGSVRETGSE